MRTCIKGFPFVLEGSKNEDYLACLGESVI